MTKKTKQFTQDDLRRIQQREAKKHGGGVSSGGLTSIIQSTLDSKSGKDGVHNGQK